MKKCLVVNIVLACLVFYSFKPTSKSFPKGCYMSLEELKNKSPSIHCDLTIKSRYDDTDKAWIWSEDFRLFSKDKCLSKTQIANDVWAYSNDTFLYINCKAVKLQSGYAKVQTHGRFVVFYDNWVALYPAFGFVGAVIAAGTSERWTGTYLDVMDLKTSKRYTADSSYIENILTEFPDLHEKFTKEKDPNDHNVHLHYLQMINDRNE